MPTSYDSSSPSHSTDLLNPRNFPLWRALVLSFLATISASLSACERSDGSSKTPTQVSKIGLLPEGAKKPNIILILQDALRAGPAGGLRSRGRIVADNRCDRGQRGDV